MTYLSTGADTSLGRCCCLGTVVRVSKFQTRSELSWSSMMNWVEFRGAFKRGTLVGRSTTSFVRFLPAPPYPDNFWLWTVCRPDPATMAPEFWWKNCCFRFFFHNSWLVLLLLLFANPFNFLSFWHLAVAPVVDVAVVNEAVFWQTDLLFSATTLLWRHFLFGFLRWWRRRLASQWSDVISICDVDDFRFNGETTLTTFSVDVIFLSRFDSVVAVAVSKEFSKGRRSLRPIAVRLTLGSISPVENLRFKSILHCLMTKSWNGRNFMWVYII